MFNLSENFLITQAGALNRYRPIFLGLHPKGNVPSDVDARIAQCNNWREMVGVNLGYNADPLVRALADDRPAIVHAHFAPDGLRAIPLADAFGVPLVVSLHGFDVNQSLGSMLFSGMPERVNYVVRRQRLFARCDMFLAVSEFLRRKAIEVGFPAERLETLYMGINTTRFSPVGAEPKEGLIVHVGRLVEKKGTDILLRAFAGLRAQNMDVQLVIIGDGHRRQRLERLAKTLGISNSVTFCGALPLDSVIAWLRKAWVAATPSITARNGDAEGLPTTVLEAASLGVPVVGTRHAGIPEAIEDGKSGILVPERDVAALASALERVLSSPEIRNQMGVKARELMSRKFEQSRQVAKLESIYDDLVEEKRRSAI